MDKCLIYSNAENTQAESKTKIYTPNELNNLLMDHINKITPIFKNIYLIGDITECKLWKRCGLSFKLFNNNYSFECKVWEKDGCSLNYILENENNNCIVNGYLTAEYFYNHKFILNVVSIKPTQEESKINNLIDICKKERYFENKKSINWDKISNIGIISKSMTQGYNDFMKQLKIPVNITLEEIILEGKNTSKQCIFSIEKLKHNDLIIIIRGGGSTSEISNSFDKIELFKKIKESNIPIITAIGHEADKGDKLLITEISDLNYSTPSTASFEIVKNICVPIINNLKNYKTKIENLIEIFFEKKKYKYFNSLTTYFSIYRKDKLGTDTIINLDENTDFIIIQKGGIFYKNIINYDNILDLSCEEIKNFELIEEDLNNYKIDKIFNYFEKNVKNKKKYKTIYDTIEKIKIILKIEGNYKNNESCFDCQLMKKFTLNKLKIQDLIKLHKNYNWYIEILEKGGKEQICNIFDFCKTSV